MPLALRIAIAVAIGVLIWRVGTALLRSFAAAPRPGPQPEDVEDLEVFLICRECGTEFRVTRLGELQVPRHCGEKMEVVRRLGPGPALPPG